LEAENGQARQGSIPASARHFAGKLALKVTDALAPAHALIHLGAIDLHVAAPTAWEGGYRGRRPR